MIDAENDPKEQVGGLPICRPGCRTQSGQVNHTFCRTCKERHKLIEHTKRKRAEHERL